MNQNQNFRPTRKKYMWIIAKHSCRYCFWLAHFFPYYKCIHDKVYGTYRWKPWTTCHNLFHIKVKLRGESRGHHRNFINFSWISPQHDSTLPHRQNTHTHTQNEQSHFWALYGVHRHKHTEWNIHWHFVQIQSYKIEE